ncbi:hypothetical protein OSB04_013491 [Centaurea solstitialis]|uniref:TIR domain-containing protein n=1 Tax=Centaurea solstitialis TaxID=347529 RepID=A0AA38WF25_9ASTR|nr:hypothetical protein OSB04_013491 [Centaurea solstitialis]
MVIISEIIPASSSSLSTLDHRYDVFISFRGSDTRFSFTNHLYNTLVNANITTFLDDEEIETGQPLKPELDNAIRASRASIIVLSRNYGSSTWCLDELVLILEQQLRNRNYFVIPIFYHVEPTDIMKQESFGEAMAKHSKRMETETNAEKRSEWAQKIKQWSEALTKVAGLKVEYIPKDRSWKAREITPLLHYLKCLVVVATVMGKVGGGVVAMMMGKVAVVVVVVNKVGGDVCVVAMVVDKVGGGGGGRKEVGFIEEIVTKIRCRLGVLLSSPQPLIMGRDYRIKAITTWLNDESSHTGDIFTISGMGGIGKTTLAKYVYRLNCGEFQRSSFVEGIGRTCAQQYNGLLDLQKQICGDISIPSSTQARGDAYTSKIENALAHKQVFLVLDDVGSVKQLEALLGNKGFHPGCKVIITTQDASLTERYLLNFVVRPKHTKCLLEGLDDYESLNLLSLSAFSCNDSKEGYEDVSNKLVEYCKGHPLALEVLGKALRNKDVAQWEDYLERLLKKGPLSDIKKVFQISLDSLEEDEKELFKHIACFYVGKDRESTEIILKACEFHTVSGIKNLVDRSLLTIGGHDKLMMHQLIQETGRDIVRQESPNRPEKRSRLWCHEESFKVLKQKKGKGNVLGLVLDMRMLEKDKLYELETDALSKMDNLKLLQLNYVQLKGSYKNFPEELRWLCMHGFPFYYLPPGLQLENLVGLDMSYSRLISFDMSYGDAQQSKKRRKVTESGSKDKPLLRSLKILNLSCCAQLHSLGGFSEFPTLERLMLSKCINLIEVCESIEQCDELEHIDLSYCNESGKLLQTIGKAKNVKILNLDGCNLGELPIQMRDDMELQEMVEGNNFYINSQTSSSAIVKAIPRCVRSHLIYLPSSLVCLSLGDNNLSNESFPKDMSSLSMLKELYLDRNDIVSLPTCLRTLPTLEKLNLAGCHRLERLEHPPRTLKWLVFGFNEDNRDGGVVFDRDMSPIKLGIAPYFTTTYHGSLIEGLFKFIDMADVREGVLRSLGWTDLDFPKVQPVNRRSKVEMKYEFGIFRIRYMGKEMPNWISDRREGSSISFTVPSSPYSLRGLNFCFMYSAVERMNYNVGIKISNITKNLTWIYRSQVDFECTIYLSHWMFGKNEMEDGDQITITLDANKVVTRECGVSFVYGEDDDGKNKMEEEEDALGYYKSWNHIIGGDLSPFQTTTPGVYQLNTSHFTGYNHGYNYVGCIRRGFSRGHPSWYCFHPSIRLTVQFQELVIHVAPKCVVFRKDQNITYDLSCPRRYGINLPKVLQQRWWCTGTGLEDVVEYPKL